jgi:hypothetical protein
MKALASAISMTALAALASTARAPAALAEGSGCAAGAASGYPTFCAIPLPPHDVRTPAQFKTAVVAVRLSGRSVTRDADAGGWSLAEGAAAAFGAEARAEAAPPPPMTSPDSDAADFARAARQATTPPPRPH